VAVRAARTADNRRFLGKAHQTAPQAIQDRELAPVAGAADKVDGSTSTTGAHAKPHRSTDVGQGFAKRHLSLRIHPPKTIPGVEGVVWG